MQCPKCGVEAAIMNTRTEITGDQSPETQTRVWSVLMYQCRNPACKAFRTDVGETRHLVFPERSAETSEAGD